VHGATTHSRETNHSHRQRKPTSAARIGPSTTELTPFGRGTETGKEVFEEASAPSSRCSGKAAASIAREVMPEFRSGPEHERRIQLEKIDTEAFKDRYGNLAVNGAPEKPTIAAAGRQVFPRWPNPTRSAEKICSVFDLFVERNAASVAKATGRTSLFLRSTRHSSEAVPSS
jgi:hypothetical protein